MENKKLNKVNPVHKTSGIRENIREYEGEQKSKQDKHSNGFEFKKMLDEETRKLQEEDKEKFIRTVQNIEQIKDSMQNGYRGKINRLASSLNSNNTQKNNNKTNEKEER